MIAPSNLRPVSQALFSGLIDYAGMFPPASLSFSDAIDNFIKYQRTPNENWILGQYILLPTHLDELLGRGESFFSTLPKAISLSLVIKSPFETLERFLAPLTLYKGVLRVKSLEVVLDQDTPVEDFVANIIHIASRFNDDTHAPNLFFEVPYSPNGEELTLRLLDTIAQHLTPGCNRPGFKLRCGGAPHLIPTPQRVAFILKECALRSIPIKFTAGLHQPFCRTSSLHAPMVEYHGYFNIFFAAISAYRENSDISKLVQILTQDSLIPPSFSDEKIEWLGHSISAVEIARIRSTHVTSFGSCSFTEPIEEAKKLSWL